MTVIEMVHITIISYCADLESRPQHARPRPRTWPSRPRGWFPRLIRATVKITSLKNWKWH